ncbi:hypothetical protein SBV1_630008 [Verrucomicrobia bacterium]|nr:hypothetical protein SBV1_630008 [Verrucomicrobiota bacterium]
MHESEPVFKGQLLLDSGQLRGSFFQRAVVLVCEEDAKGAFGLVLNRASGTNVGGMLVAGLPETLKGHPLFVGGPVEPSALSFLWTEAFLPNANVLPNLSVGYSWDGLCEIEGSFTPTRKDLRTNEIKSTQAQQGNTLPPTEAYFCEHCADAL